MCPSYFFGIVAPVAAGFYVHRGWHLEGCMCRHTRCMRGDKIQECDWGERKEPTQTSLEEGKLLILGSPYSSATSNDSSVTARLVPPQIHGAATGEANGTRTVSSRTRREAAAGPSIKKKPAFGSSDGTPPSSCSSFEAEKGKYYIISYFSLNAYVGTPVTCSVNIWM